MDKFLHLCVAMVTCDLLFPLQCLDDDLNYVPPDYLPIPELFSTCYQLPQQLVYHKTVAKATPSSSTASNTQKE
jgi:hypothetical protein